MENIKTGSDSYNNERIYRDEVNKLANKSVNLMKIADDLIKSDPESSKLSLENQKLNKENFL